MACVSAAISHSCKTSNSGLKKSTICAQEQSRLGDQKPMVSEERCPSSNKLHMNKRKKIVKTFYLLWRHVTLGAVVYAAHCCS